MRRRERADGTGEGRGGRRARADGAGEGRSGRSGRRGRVAAAITAVVATGAGVAAATGFDLGAEPAPASGGALPPATAPVTRETLVDTQTEGGELGYGDPITLSGRLAGTLTTLPATGATVHRGHAVYRVDDTPVVLLYGALPAYRALAPDTEGADVRQFEENLSALGYRGFTVDDEYTAATARAVKAWQEDLGLPETGTVEPGRLVYAAGPVRVDTHKAAVGDAAGAEVLTYTSTARVITVSLDVADQRLAATGAAVGVRLPAGKSVPAKITGVETVADPGEGAEAEPTTTIEVTVAVADQQALAGLGLATVDVVFTVEQRADVLTVPVAALLALPDGGYGVEVVRGRSTRIVPVTTGLFAGGRVEVSGDGLTEGMAVGVPS